MTHPDRLAERQLTFQDTGTWVARFTADQRIEINPEYTAEGAAAEFVRIVHEMAGKSALVEAVATEPVNLAPYYCTDCENHIRQLHDGRCACGSGRVVAAPSGDSGALREALERMVYETTSLSPLEDDGSHWCRISKEAMDKARDALRIVSDD